MQPFTQVHRDIKTHMLFIDTSSALHTHVTQTLPAAPRPLTESLPRLMSPENPSQSVRVGNQISEVRTVNTGTPQS